MLQVVGPINPPPGIAAWIGTSGGAVPGLIPFLNALLKFAIVIAGLYALLNLILAGYGFMSASGDPKAVEKAWGKIWQTLVGLLIVAGAFVLAALFGWLFFGSATAILNPQIYSP